MFKRSIIATLALAFMAVQAFAAGSISLSLSQQFDSQGRPLSGGKLYFFQAGTLTPQNAYQDTGLTLAHPNPITLDASGRVPSFYLADGSIKIRLADANGVTIIAVDGLLVIGPSSGGGGGGVVDATTILATGDVKAKYGTGSITGFVRLNGRTIGSATSGATERANSDVQTLFEYLWTNDANLAVSSGRGGSANADWLANKTITLPDFRGRVPAALDDMGNSAAGRLTATYFGAVGTTLGAAGGAESHTLSTAQIASHQHDSFINDPGHSHDVKYSITGVTTGGTNVVLGISSGGGTTGVGGAVSATTGVHVKSSSGGATDDKTAATGGGTAHNNTQPTILVTYYVKM